MKAFPANPEKKLIAVYLSESGCWAYSREMINQIRPVAVISSQHHKDDFPNHLVKTLETQSTKIKLAAASLLVKQKIKKLVVDLQTKVGELQLYFPAFHPWNLIFLQVAEDMQLPTLLTIHDYHTHTGEKSSLTESIQKKCITLAEHVIFLSAFVKNQAEQELGQLEKFSVSPHPLLPVSRIQSLPHRPELKLLFLGRVIAYKGVELLVEAMQNHKMLTLTLAGRQQGASFRSTSSIQVINKYLTEEEIGELLSSHHVLILPYTNASQSGIISLGVSAEIPMIITKTGGLPEQIPEHCALWIEPASLGISKAITRLKNEPTLYQNLKASLRDYKRKLKKST